MLTFSSPAQCKILQVVPKHTLPIVKLKISLVVKLRVMVRSSGKMMMLKMLECYHFSLVQPK